MFQVGAGVRLGYFCAAQFSWIKLSVFAYGFSWMKSGTSKCNIRGLPNSFSSLSITLEQIYIFKTSIMAGLAGVSQQSPSGVGRVRDFLGSSFPCLSLMGPSPHQHQLRSIQGANLPPPGRHWSTQRPWGLVRGWSGDRAAAAPKSRV